MHYEKMVVVNDEQLIPRLEVLSEILGLPLGTMVLDDVSIFDEYTLFTGDPAVKATLRVLYMSSRTLSNGDIQLLVRYETMDGSERGFGWLETAFIKGSTLQLISEVELAYSMDDALLKKLEAGVETMKQA